MLGRVSAILSLDQEPFQQLPSEVGEVPGAARPFEYDAPKVIQDYAHVCGSDADFLCEVPQDLEALPTTYDNQQLPSCCGQPLVQQTGVMIGYEPEVEVIATTPGGPACLSAVPVLAEVWYTTLISATPSEQWYALGLLDLTNWRLETDAPTGTGVTLEFRRQACPTSLVFPNWPPGTQCVSYSGATGPFCVRVRGITGLTPPVTVRWRVSNGLCPP